MKYLHIKILFLTFIISITACDNKKEKEEVEKLKDVDQVTKSESSDISKINFYFENSASMNGYLTGDDFLETLNRIIGNMNEEILNSYFVNTSEYAADNILDRIEKRNIKTMGIENSDHQFIFENAIKNATDNELSIVITDGIYSVDGKSPNIVSIKIENAFKKALQQNEIETVILKLSSNFNGTYYSESCEPGHKAIKINQERPYYVLLFGNSEIINKAMNEIVVIKDLPGFKEQARFFITKNKSINYTILTQGEEKHANKLEAENKYSKDNIKSIKGERFALGGFKSTPKEDKYLRFGIAIDYSKYSLPDSYLTDVNNYEVDDKTGYKVVKVTNISNLKSNTKTYDVLENLKTKYTHIIIVKATNGLFGDLEIDLKKNLPSWIRNSGMDNDCEIIDNTTQTFAFDQLINGISKAYEKVNDNDKYIELKLKIKV
ncbi:MAG: hypothetical protein L3J08_08460 [Flavobacteriaceae bacterium]|nr:hypothetical protein [Flavobacteriaceae bacterium]